MDTLSFIQFWTLFAQEINRTFRVVTQVFAAPLINALLYIFIFGYVVGGRIQNIGDVSYLDFLLPGILMMNVISSSFLHGSNSIYFKRFIKQIEEVLVAPVPTWVYVGSIVASGVVRSLLIGLGVFLIAVFFGAANLDNVLLFVFYAVLVATIFTLLGVIVGLWAKGFEQLNVLNIFLIMPLSYLGGVFYSITMLPDWFAGLVRWNPFFYFIDGIRYSMIGVSESSLMLGVGIITFLIIGLSILIAYLFNIGYGIRE